MHNQRRPQQIATVTTEEKRKHEDHIKYGGARGGAVG
jgi:hypothetical protein